MSDPELPIIRPGLDIAAIEPEAPAEVTGCWGTSGVYGDASCPELSTVVHCRNCPVYSAAAVRLIDRPLPVNYRQEWTDHFARSRPLPELGTASLVLFRLQNEWLAMPTHNFQEVAERRPIHSLPRRREAALLGLANVRGELVICISWDICCKLIHRPPWMRSGAITKDFWCFRASPIDWHFPWMKSTARNDSSPRSSRVLPLLRPELRPVIPRRLSSGKTVPPACWIHS